MAAIICDFGKREGYHLYRINGSKDELEKAFNDLKEVGAEIWEPYEIQDSWKCLSVLIKVQYPAEIEKLLEQQKAELEERQRISFEQRDKFRGMKK